jgi:hypothetical protein
MSSVELKKQDDLLSKYPIAQKIYWIRVASQALPNLEEFKYLCKDEKQLSK